MTIAERQRYALEHPKLESVFATKRDEKVRQMSKIGPLRISSVLTIDTTGDKLAWHASIAVLTKRGEIIKPLGNISVNAFEKIMAELQQLLEGVGQGDTWTYPPDFHIHLFRELTPAERAQANKFSAANN